MEKDRERKIEELMEGFESLRRFMAFRPISSGKMARITSSQWGVLLLIGRHGKSTVKEVAKSLGISSSAATQLVDGLVASGYVLREENAEDHRSVSLTPSPKTKKHFEQMKKQAIQKFLRVLEVLNDREFDDYITVNKKIIIRTSKK